MPTGLLGKHEQAVSAKAGGHSPRYSPGSSSSSSGEKKRSLEAEADIREWREELKRCNNVEKEQRNQSEMSVGEDGVDGEWKMDIMKRWIARKSWISERECCKNSFGISMDVQISPKDIRDVLGKIGRKSLQDIEQWRHDLMPEQQKMQKRPQKLQRLQDKKNQCQKDMVLLWKEA